MSYYSGFAEGLNSANSIWRTVNNKQYQDEMYSLRQAGQAMRQRELDQNDRFRRDSLDQQKQFHQDEMGLRQADQRMRQQIADRSYNLQQARFAYEQRKAHDQELQPVFQEALAILGNGGTVPPEMLDKLAGSNYDLGMISGFPYRAAVKAITDTLSQDPDKINTAENLNNLNTVLAPELKSVAGQVDPATGKTMTGREITGIVPSPDGKYLVPRFRVAYTDGSRQDNIPLTKYGTTHPDDPLIALPKDWAGRQMFARAAAAALISSGPNAQALAGSGKNTLRKAAADKIADLEKERLKSDSKLAASLPVTPGDDGKSARTLQDVVDANDKRYQDLEQHLYSVYGVNPPASANTAEEGDIARQQMFADKDFPGFRQAMAAKKWDVEKIPTEQLGPLFEKYKEYVAKNARATSMAEQMRENHKSIQ